MSAVPLTAEASVHIVADATDAQTSRTWATNPEVIELVRAASEKKTGRRWYRNVGENCANVYDELRKRELHAERSSDGGVVVSRWQLARALYDVTDDRDAHNKARTIDNCIRRLEWAGLVSHEVHTSRAGKTVGIVYRLLPVEEALAKVLGPRRSSSVG